jgi:tetratricopeptide (TPR) repeat protein
VAWQIIADMTRLKIRLVQFFLAASCAASPAVAQKSVLPWLPPLATATLDKIYDGDPEGAIEQARQLQQEDPEHPLGYVLEAEAEWWKVWCVSAEYKYGMTMARHRAALAADRPYLDLTAKISALAERQIKTRETAEMRFYDGMGHALAARLYGLRWESRNTARAGVRARENFARALVLDPGFSDAYLGLGLYNYYVDTLSGMARVLRFMMGIPGGSKQEGIRQLKLAIADGVLTPVAARFYLVINLHNFDQRYGESLEILLPLVEKYRGNPLFQLAAGDLYAKLGRRELAEARYRAAAAIPVRDAECAAHVQKLAQAALSSLDPGAAH